MERGRSAGVGRRVGWVTTRATDVEVRSRPLRWHVMVHSVVSFFYNAIMLAVAVGVITGK